MRQVLQSGVGEGVVSSGIGVGVKLGTGVDRLGEVVVPSGVGDGRGLGAGIGAGLDRYANFIKDVTLPPLQPTRTVDASAFPETGYCL